jgi:hypothetical protein
MTESPIVDRRIRVFLRNGFRYRGTCIFENDRFLHLNDERSGRLTILAKSEIFSLEVFDDENENDEQRRER